MVYLLISVAPTILLMGGGVAPAFLELVIVPSVMLQFICFFEGIFLHPSST